MILQYTFVKKSFVIYPRVLEPFLDGAFQLASARAGKAVQGGKHDSSGPSTKVKRPCPPGDGTARAGQRARTDWCLETAQLAVTRAIQDAKM